jgi:protein-tyrosine phosphatase
MKTYIPIGCKEHGIMAEVSLSEGIEGALFRAAGIAVTKKMLKQVGIDVYIPLTEEARVKHPGRFWPMVDYSCWPVEELAQKAIKIARVLLNGKRVCIACHGGHGRTGTLLAAVAVIMYGVEDPVEWVREVYCSHAVESKIQEETLRELVEYVG